MPHVLANKYSNVLPKLARIQSVEKILHQRVLLRYSVSQKKCVQSVFFDHTPSVQQKDGAKNCRFKAAAAHLKFQLI